MTQQTVVELLASEINARGPKKNNPPQWLRELYAQAKEKEKQQHGNTWDNAIKAHDNRGHVISRSITDFDEYYTETYGK